MMHTKGPWTINPYTHGGAPEIEGISTAYGARRVCKVLYAIGSEDAEVHANTRLIAAAPELLEAAEHAIKELGQLVGLIPLIAAVYKAKE